MHGTTHGRRRHLAWPGAALAASPAADDAGSALSANELESRPIELGFAEGAKVEVMHEGIVRRDPIAVRVENVTIAVRRREAMAITVG
jgi:ferrous iron transport protein A